MIYLVWNSDIFAADCGGNRDWCWEGLVSGFSGATIAIRVWDKNSQTRDDVLGVARLPLCGKYALLDQNLDVEYAGDGEHWSEGHRIAGQPRTYATSPANYARKCANQEAFTQPASGLGTVRVTVIFRPVVINNLLYPSVRAVNSHPVEGGDDSILDAASKLVSASAVADVGKAAKHILKKGLIGLKKRMGAGDLDDKDDVFEFSQAGTLTVSDPS